MNYLIVEKLSNGTNHVVLGPMSWRPTFFKNCLLDDLEIDFDVPLSNDDQKTIIVNKNVKIIPVKESNKSFEYNPKIHNLAGPFYDYFDTHAESYWVPQEKSVEQLRLELKTEVSSNRYIEEIKGVNITIQGKEISVPTTREIRNQFLQYHLLGKDGINWKLNGEFITLSNSDLEFITTEILNHIQSVFDWESSKFIEIDSIDNLIDLSKISTKF